MGVGSYEGKHDVALIMRDGKQYRVDVKHRNAHWVGQAVFKHGVVVSDELLCNTDVELSSSEVGTIQAQERPYMSLLQHPGAIENKGVLMSRVEDHYSARCPAALNDLR